MRYKAIIGGRLIDGTGMKPLDDSAILIEGSKIRSVGTKGEVKIPEDAEIDRSIDRMGRR